MKYLKIRKMEKPFYFTYEKIREIMKEYLPDVNDFCGYIDCELHDEHCENTRCSECAFRARNWCDQRCSLVAPRVRSVPNGKCWLSDEHAEGLVNGLNKTRDICSKYANCDCDECWLREGPEALYLCGGKEMNNEISGED